MNYLKVYCNLIRKAENRTPPDGYTEKHHTFPVSIYGKNSRIVILTAREHYIAHALLVKICKKRYSISHTNTHKMIYAYNLMYNSGKCNTSGLYEYYKRYFCEHHPNKNEEYRERKRKEMIALGENNPSKTPEFKKKMSERWKGGNNPMKREDVRKKISTQMTVRMLTDANPTKGKKRPEHSDKMCKYVYLLTSPDGNEYNTTNLLKFARENNLDASCLRKTEKDEKKFHKGWKCKKIGTIEKN